MPLSGQKQWTTTCSRVHTFCSPAHQVLQDPDGTYYCNLYIVPPSVTQALPVPHGKSTIQDQRADVISCESEGFQKVIQDPEGTYYCNF